MSRMAAGGTFPVLPAIFDEAGELDLTGFAAVVRFVLDCGVDGVVVPGLASEYDQLSLAERHALVRTAGELTRDRATLVVGASGRSDEETRSMLAVGVEVGAAAAMIMTPGRLGDDLGALIDFYGDMAQAGLAIMLQNAPPPMGSGLNPGQVRSILAAVPAISFVKEENTPCGQRISELLMDPPRNLLGVFGGAGGRYIVDELARGAIGTMPASELPELSVALMAAHREGRTDDVRCLYERMLPILVVQAVFRWDLTKQVLKRRGLIGSAHVRASGPRMDERDGADLDAMLARLPADLGGGSRVPTP